MKTRSSYADVVYNGANVTKRLSGYLTGFSYSDPAEGEADSITLTIQDRGWSWISEWLPQVGDKLSATIGVRNYTAEGDDRALPCGDFVLDDYEFSGWPVTGSISAVSVPASTDFRETARTKTWENVTIAQIGAEIAGRAGIALTYDAPEVLIKSMEQTEQTDCDFFTALCEEYGIMIKVYANKLVAYEREAYKAKRTVGRLSPPSIESWSWRERLSGTYTGGKYTYTDPETGEEIAATVGEGPRVLSINGKADSAADALKKITAAVQNANHGAKQMSIRAIGNAYLVASQCIEVADMGGLSGKYYIDKITHDLGGSSGYTMQLELSKVE